MGSQTYICNITKPQNFTTQLLALAIAWLTRSFCCPASCESIVLHITSSGKDPYLKFKVQSLFNACCFHTIIKWKNCKSNHYKSGTICMCLPLTSLIPSIPLPPLFLPTSVIYSVCLPTGFLELHRCNHHWVDLTIRSMPLINFIYLFSSFLFHE